VSPRARRWAWNLGQVGLTILALAWVARLVQFRDAWRVKDAAGVWTERPDAVEARLEGGDVVLVDRAGGESRHPADRVARREGFLSLLDRVNKGAWFALAAAFLLPFAVLALRWWLLLRGHGFPVPYRRVFFVTYAGIFFNNLLPGGVGGDLTKAVLAAEGEDRKAAVVGTVLLDRVIGLVVMIFLGAACLAPYAAGFRDRRVVFLVYGMAGAVVVGYLLYFNPLLRKVLPGRLPFRSTLGQLDGVFRSARERRGLMAATAALSLVSQGGSILVIYGLARALGLSDVPLWQFFVFEPIIFIVTALPISVGGWGVQEGAYALLFGAVGGMDENAAGALSVLVKLSMLLVSVPGGVLFSMGAARRGVSPPSPV
jgi:hypothetical protein